MFGAAIGACEQSIFPGKRDGADGAFDGIVVELDATIVDEARQTFPARQGVADGFGEFALLTDQSKFCPQPRFEGVEKGAAFLLSDGATFVGTAATDVFLDGVERGDMLERFAGNRRRSGGGELVEVSPDMRPAERKSDVATIGQLAVTGIAVDLQDTLEALEVSDGPLGFAIGRVDIGNARWIRPTPGTVIGGKLQAKTVDLLPRGLGVRDSTEAGCARSGRSLAKAKPLSNVAVRLERHGAILCPRSPALFS